MSALNVATTSTDGKKSSKLLIISTPTDRALAVEGSTIWELRGSDIGDQVDELIREGRVTDAIGLVEAVGDIGLEPVRFAITFQAHFPSDSACLISAS